MFADKGRPAAAARRAAVHASLTRRVQDLNDPEEPEPIEEPHSPMSSAGFDPALEFDMGEDLDLGGRPARGKRRQVCWPSVWGGCSYKPGGLFWPGWARHVPVCQ